MANEKQIADLKAEIINNQDQLDEIKNDIGKTTDQQLIDSLSVDITYLTDINESIRHDIATLEGDDHD